MKQNLYNYSTQDLNIIIMYMLHTHYTGYLCHVEIGMEWNTNAIELNLYNILPI